MDISQSQKSEATDATGDVKDGEPGKKRRRTGGRVRMRLGCLYTHSSLCHDPHKHVHMSFLHSVPVDQYPSYREIMDLRG